MGEGLRFARLATFCGKKNAVLYGEQPVTVGAVGYQDGKRFVMATAADGTVILGQPDDFDVRVRLPRKRRK